MCPSVAHVLKIGYSETEATDLNDKIHRFWDLDKIGISNKEIFVYEKFKNNITLQEGSYSERLPTKGYHPFRSSHLRCSVKKVFLKPATLFWHRCFPVKFVNFLRSPFFIEQLWWLLLSSIAR